jgi:hypothetical protein
MKVKKEFRSTVPLRKAWNGFRVYWPTLWVYPHLSAFFGTRYKLRINCGFLLPRLWISPLLAISRPQRVSHFGRKTRWQVRSMKIFCI